MRLEWLRDTARRDGPFATVLLDCRCPAHVDRALSGLVRSGAPAAVRAAVGTALDAPIPIGVGEGCVLVADDTGARLLVLTGEPASRARLLARLSRPARVVAVEVEHPGGVGTDVVQRAIEDGTDRLRARERAAVLDRLDAASALVCSAALAGASVVVTDDPDRPLVGGTAALLRARLRAPLRSGRPGAAARSWATAQTGAASSV